MLPATPDAKIPFYTKYVLRNCTVKREIILVSLISIDETYDRRTEKILYSRGGL